MSNHGNEYLTERIKELEEELSLRDRDLAEYRQELISANKKLERLIVELNQELKVVHSIQKCLIPTEFPNIQGFEFSSKFIPSTHRGGDYFDVFEHDDRSRFGIMMASSSGHMMSALLLSVLLKVTGQAEAKRGSKPDALMRLICGELAQQMDARDMAEIFYGLIDRKSSSLKYTKAGHILADYFDYDTSKLVPLESKNNSLLAGQMQYYESYEIPLNPRDRIVLATKGLIEAKNLDGGEFGLERLENSLFEVIQKPVHEVRNHVLYGIQKFTSGQEPLRDQTFLVIEVKDRVIQLAKK
jgi:sigma-B regulation protein RsbU (phosphoserine phosphatase)